METYYQVLASEQASHLTALGAALINVCGEFDTLYLVNRKRGLKPRFCVRLMVPVNERITLTTYHNVVINIEEEYGPFDYVKLVVRGSNII